MSRTRVVSERPALPRGVGAGDAGRGWRQPLIVLGVLATLVAGLGVPAARAQEPPPERQAILDQLTQINQQLAQAQDLLQGQPSQDAIRQAHDLIAKAGDASWSLLRQPPLSTESIFGIALGAWVQFFDALDTDLGDAHGHLLDADWDLRQGRESAAADDAAYARGHLLDARSGLNAMLNTAGLEDDGRAALLQIRDQIDAIIGTLDSDSPTSRASRQPTPRWTRSTTSRSGTAATAPSRRRPCSASRWRTGAGTSPR